MLRHRAKASGRLHPRLLIVVCDSLPQPHCSVARGERMPRGCGQVLYAGRHLTHIAWACRTPSKSNVFFSPVSVELQLALQFVELL